MKCDTCGGHTRNVRCEECERYIEGYLSGFEHATRTAVLWFASPGHGASPSLYGSLREVRDGLPEEVENDLRASATRADDRPSASVACGEQGDR